MLANNDKDLKMPAFSDEEQNRKAIILRVTSIALLLGAIAGMILFLIDGSFNLILAFSFMLFGAVISLLLLHFSYIKLASWTLLLWVLVSLFMVIFIADGIHDTMMLLFPISILIASMLLGKRDFIAYSLIVFVSLQTFIVFELVGIINNPMSNHTTFLDMISIGILVALAIVLTYTMSDSMSRSFLKANRSNESLKEINFKLLDEMKERNKIENELKTKVGELEQYKKATVDRELKMMELKEKIYRLNREKGCVNETSQ